jgi:hypothetical protein
MIVLEKSWGTFVSEAHYERRVLKGGRGERYRRKIRARVYGRGRIVGVN